jgi:hypothetical protein
MTFYGQENVAKEVAVDTPLRTYEYNDFAGRRHVVKAHYIQFSGGHVSFWQRRSDNEQDTLVRSEANTQVNALQEVPS